MAQIVVKSIHAQRVWPLLDIESLCNFREVYMVCLQQIRLENITEPGVTVLIICGTKIAVQPLPGSPTGAHGQSPRQNRQRPQATLLAMH